MKRAAGVVEWADDAERWPRAAVEGNLADMGRFLVRLGCGARARRFVGRATAGLARVRVLDVAAGCGWLSRSLDDPAGMRGARVKTVALDAGECAVRLCLVASGTVCRADARALPFRSGAFDAAVCTGFLHHLEPDELPGFLRELDRVCTRGWWAGDLLRSRRLWVAAVFATRLLSRNSLTRHDGPLSVRRAYTAGELCTAAAQSGIPGVRVAHCGRALGSVWRIAPCVPRAQGSGVGPDGLRRGAYTSLGRPPAATSPCA